MSRVSFHGLYSIRGVHRKQRGVKQGRSEELGMWGSVVTAGNGQNRDQTSMENGPHFRQISSVSQSVAAVEAVRV